jgi:hypothetical protein
MRLEVSLLTVQFLVQVPSRRDGQRPDELLKLYGTILWTRVAQLSLQKPFVFGGTKQLCLSVTFGYLPNCTLHV